VVHAASVQDRDGAALVLTKRVRRRCPFIATIFADAGYQGPRVREAARRSGRWRIEIVKRSDRTGGFVVEANRWIVERTLAWISRNRRLRPRLRKSRPNRQGAHLPRHDQAHAAPPRQSMTFLDSS
jgi:putative transposase